MRSLLSAIGRFLSELRRRKVYQVALAYVVVGFMVIEAADLTLVRLGLPAWTVTFVVVLVGLGFPIALVLAWALEVTPEGVRVEEASAEETEESGDLPARASSQRDLWVGVSVLVLLLFGAWWMWGGLSGEEGGESASRGPAGGTTKIEERSIAVLPFENMAGPDNEQFTEGIHDGLLTRLSNVSDLKVISRTSVGRYEGTEKPLPEVARELGVQWIVEGAVQRAGGQVQVNAQLIDARTDAHRWAEDYQRKLTPDNVFDLQGEIAGQIATSLEAELSPEEQERVQRRPTDDLTAYQLYVQGRRELARRLEGDLEKAVRLFRQSIKRDSSFALAWSGLADAAGSRWWGFEGYDTLSVTPEKAAQRAVELDPDLAEAHASMGLVHFRNRNGPAALRSLHRAVDLKPSYAEAHNWLGLTYLVLGRQEAGLRHLELARDFDPQHLLARHYLYDTYVSMGEVERGLEAIREQQRRYPEYLGPYIAETRALYALGRYEEAGDVVREHLLAAMAGRLEESVPDWSRAYLAAIETALGDTLRARKLLAELRERDQPPIVMAYAHAAFGNVDATLSAFEEIDDWSYVPTSTLRYLTFPEGMTPIRHTPRYEALIREVNEYWGLGPDGSIPDDADVPPTTEPETDA